MRHTRFTTPQAVPTCLGVLLVLLGSLSGCSKKAAPPPAPAAAITESGVASWYGHPFDGRKTANGETYNMEQMTAAHRTYAFGTVVRVHNRANKQSVEVRINDRGPFVAQRVIDLSHGAAQQIAMPSIATVDLEVISRPRQRAAENFAVQLGASPLRSDAELLQRSLAARYGTARLIFRDGSQTWSVLAGMEPTAEAADRLRQQIGTEFGPAFVVLLDPDDPDGQ